MADLEAGRVTIGRRKRPRRDGEGTGNFKAALSVAEQRRPPFIGETIASDRIFMPEHGHILSSSACQAQAIRLATEILGQHPERRTSLSCQEVFTVSRSVDDQQDAEAMLPKCATALLKSCSCQTRGGGRRRKLPADNPVIDKQDAKTMTVSGSASVVKVRGHDNNFHPACAVGSLCTPACMLNGLVRGKTLHCIECWHVFPI